MELTLKTNFHMESIINFGIQMKQYEMQRVEDPFAFHLSKRYGILERDNHVIRYANYYVGRYDNNASQFDSVCEHILLSVLISNLKRFHSEEDPCLQMTCINAFSHMVLINERN